MTSPGAAGSSTFVGRMEELEQLRVALAATRSGRTAVFVIGGEAGIGKTRLVRELSGLAAAAGVQMMLGSCWDIDRSSPLAPVIDLVGEISEPGFFVDAADERAIDHQLDTEAHVQRQKRRLFSMLVEKLDDMSIRSSTAPRDPLVIAVEDIHWSDDTTLEFLPYLARSSRRPLLLVLTLRPDEADLAVDECLAAFERLRLVTELHLAPLSDDEGADLIRAEIGAAVPKADYIRRVLALADGNPLFIEEIVRTGRLTTTGSWKLDSVPIPHTVAAAVRRRVAALDSTTARLLDVASVLGRRFEFVLLCDVAEIAEGDGSTSIGSLVAAGLLVDDGASHLVFRHALIQTAVYAALPVRHRASLHRRAARTIVQRSNRPKSEQIAQLAHHFYAAGDWEQTLVWAGRACAQAATTYAPRAVVEHASRSIDASARLGVAPSLGVLRTRGVAHEWLGNFDEAWIDHEETLAQARAAEDRVAVWRSLIDLGALSRERDFVRAGEFFAQALVIARGLDDRRPLARTLGWVGFWEMMADDLTMARQHQEEAIAIFETLGDREGIAETAEHLGWTYYVCADLPASFAAYERAVDIRRSLDDPQGLAGALAGRATRGCDYFHLPSVWPVFDEGACLRDAEEAVSFASEIAWRSGQARAEIWRALTLGVRGHYGDAFAAARRGHQIALDDNQVRYLATAHIALGALWLDVLDVQRAIVDLERAVALAQEMGSSTVVSTATSFLVSARLAHRDTRGAADALGPQRVGGPVDSMPHRLLACAQVELALAEHDADLALAMVDRIIAGARHAAPGVVTPRLWYLRGEALGQLARWQEAAAVLDAGAAGASRLGQRGVAWRILVTHGKIEQLQGHRTRAGELYDRARVVVESLADSLADEERTGFLSAFATRIPGRAHAAVSRDRARGELTTRESEIALLVSQGLANREIAEKLVLSLRTVEKHVENVLMKLGLRSRVQLAVWVVDHTPA